MLKSLLPCKPGNSVLHRGLRPMNWERRYQTTERPGLLLCVRPTHRRASSNVTLIVAVFKSICMYYSGIHQYVVKGKRTTRVVSFLYHVTFGKIA